MAKDLSDLVCALAGPVTQRTLENLRRTLEDLYVRSTAQGSTAEEQAAFNPQLIEQAHEAAKRDNAKTIVLWALAIQNELSHAEHTAQRITKIQGYLSTARDKLAFFRRELQKTEADPQMSAEDRQRYQEATTKAILVSEAEVSSLTHSLRTLQEPPPPVPGHPPPAWARQMASRDGDVAGDLPPLS